MIDDKQRAYLISSLENLDEIRDRLMPIDRKFANIRIFLYDCDICSRGIDKVNKCFHLLEELDEAIKQLDAEIVRTMAWEEEE